jgi:hypothetical protein
MRTPRRSSQSRRQRRKPDRAEARASLVRSPRQVASACRGRLAWHTRPPAPASRRARRLSYSERQPQSCALTASHDVSGESVASCGDRLRTRLPSDAAHARSNGPLPRPAEALSCAEMKSGPAADHGSPLGGRSDQVRSVSPGSRRAARPDGMTRNCAAEVLIAAITVGRDP